MGCFPLAFVLGLVDLDVLVLGLEFKNDPESDDEEESVRLLVFAGDVGSETLKDRKSARCISSFVGSGGGSTRVFIDPSRDCVGDTGGVKFSSVVGGIIAVIDQLLFCLSFAFSKENLWKALLPGADIGGVGSDEAGSNHCSTALLSFVLQLPYLFT